MDFDPDQRRRALQRFMQREDKLNPNRWEEAAELGEGTLRKFLNGKPGEGTMTDRTYSRLALGAGKILGRPVSVSELQDMQLGHPDGDGSSTDPHVMLEERQQILNAPPRKPPNRVLPGIPVYGTSLAGSEGDFQMNNGEAVDHVPKPEHLAHRKGLFCLYVEGESMRPWKKPGQIVYLDPTRRPQIGDHVVVEMKGTPPYEDRPAFLKLLVGRSATRLKLQQYRPERTFEIDLKRINRILRVMPEEEILGV